MELLKKVGNKIKELGKRLVKALTESNKRRAERAMNWEMHQYYRNEYGHNFLEKFPYHTVNRRD